MSNGSDLTLPLTKGRGPRDNPAFMGHFVSGDLKWHECYIVRI